MLHVVLKVLEMTSCPVSASQQSVTSNVVVNDAVLLVNEVQMQAYREFLSKRTVDGNL